MSILIEDSLYKDQKYQEKQLKVQKTSLQYKQILFNTKANKYSIKIRNFKQRFLPNTPNLYGITIDSQRMIHKFQNYSLIILKKIFDSTKFGFEGIILKNDQKYFIKQKQKRILFGKQWIRNKVKRHPQLVLCFETGQIKIYWPQLFYADQHQDMNNSKFTAKIFNQIYMQGILFFQQEVIPVIKQVVQNFIKSNNEQDDETECTQNVQYEVSINKLQKYLYMSTIIDTFSKDKQSYKKIQDKFVKQKQNIVRVQKNIDVTFSNIATQLNLYSFNTIKIQKNKLKVFGLLQVEQKKVLQDLCANTPCRTHFQSQQQFVLNCIGVLKIQNKKRFVSSGGSCSICVIKIIFQYIFSDDPKFWIEANKKTSNNVMQKNFVIKQAKKGAQQKIYHQNQIIKQMKGGYSIYLPRYYKIENIQNQQIQLKSDNIILMDYLKGQTLDNYANIHNKTLSFWTKVYLIKNLLCGLRFLSAYQITHLDLKPSNIIVTHELLTKLIDFGQSHHQKVCKQNYFPGVTLPYSCPQLFYKKPINYDEKCDVFSLGVIMFQLFIGLSMFEFDREKIRRSYEKQNFIRKIFICIQELNQSNINPIFNILVTLIMKCLDPSPQKRPTFNWISIIIGCILMYFRGN